MAAGGGQCGGSTRGSCIGSVVIIKVVVGMGCSFLFLCFEICVYIVLFDMCQVLPDLKSRSDPGLYSFCQMVPSCVLIEGQFRASRQGAPFPSKVSLPLRLPRMGRFLWNLVLASPQASLVFLDFHVASLPWRRIPDRLALL